MFRDVNTDRNESDSTSSCGEKRGNTTEGHKVCAVFAFLRVETARNSQKQHRKLI
jgi:hypothetical protein